jgi:peptidoglycan/LPS O-acetylase OafA/YrhL
MILFPLIGLAAGLAIGRRSAFAVTLVAAIAGFALVAALTDQIDGWYDPFVWIDTLVALLTTGLGILLRFLWQARDVHERPVAQP